MSSLQERPVGVADDIVLSTVIDLKREQQQNPIAAKTEPRSRTIPALRPPPEIATTDPLAQFPSKETAKTSRYYTD
jgi:hypothetical protein